MNKRKHSEQNYARVPAEMPDDLQMFRTQMLEINKALGLPRDNTDNTLRVRTALRLRAGIGAPDTMKPILQITGEPLEICLIRPPGRGQVYLRTSPEHPGMLVFIGLAGLPHGALIELDAKNRARLRHWLDVQESTS